MQETNTTSSIEITKQPISIRQVGIDWVSIIALVFTIISTVSTLVWQRYLRKKDKEEQQKIRKKDDELRQWNALYPYRLKFYSEFYDILFKFVNYKVQTKQHLNYKNAYITDRKLTIDGFNEFLILFNKFDEDSKVLFNTDISDQVNKIYTICLNLISELKNITSNSTELKDIVSNFQNEIITNKLDVDLKNNFMKYLKFNGENK